MPVVVGGCSGQTTMVALLVSAETFVMYSTQFTSANRSRKQFANAALFLFFFFLLFFTIAQRGTSSASASFVGCGGVRV